MHYIYFPGKTHIINVQTTPQWQTLYTSMHSLRLCFPKACGMILFKPFKSLWPIFPTVYCIAQCFRKNSAWTHPSSSILPTICFWKPIRHLCKGGKLEQRHLQLSDEASLSDRVSLSFFLLQDQIAALYITKELPAWPASLSLPSDAASVFLRQGRRVFVTEELTWLKNITQDTEIALITLSALNVNI